MKKFVLIAAVGLTAVVNAGVWMPVPGEAGNPTDIHYMHGGNVVQVTTRPNHRHSCDGGLIGAVFHAVFGSRRCRRDRDYPETIIVEQSAPTVQYVEAPPPPPPIRTPTYVKRVVDGHYVDTCDTLGRKYRVWVPAREEWVRVQ